MPALNVVTAYPVPKDVDLSVYAPTAYSCWNSLYGYAYCNPSGVQVLVNTSNQLCLFVTEEGYQYQTIVIKFEKTT